MSNELATLQLPAHLLAARTKNPAIAAIGDGIVGAHPVIKLAGTNKELFLKEGGVETSLGAELDVIIIGINPNKSIVVYGEKYDQNTDPTAPLFSSDDGTPVPNEFATKVISESRRWAVLMADNPTGPVYELRLPAASIFRGDTYSDALKKRGAFVSEVVTRLSFDKAEKYARFVFTPVSYASPEQTAAVERIAGSVEVESVLGVNRKPQRALPAPVHTGIAPHPSDIGAGIQMPAETKARRGRPTATPAPAANTLQFPGVATPSAASNVVTNPVVADSQLEQTIANVLKL